MLNRQLVSAALAGLAALALSACANDTSEPSLASEDEVVADLAAAAGDAIAIDLGELVLGERFVFGPTGAGAPGIAGSPPEPPPPYQPGVTVSRTRTCFDASGQAQTECDPLTTASVQLTMQMDGNFSRSFTGPRGSETMERAIHHARSLTISGLLGQETSRTHNGDGASNDTTHITRTPASGTDPSVERTVIESSLDSIQNIVFNLPHSTNPWPVSGTMVRRVTGSITVTVGDRTETRTIDRRIAVTFPADAQGNVQIQINDHTCTLNLVTRTVTGCS